MGMPLNQPSDELRFTIGRIRNQILGAVERDGYRWEPTNPVARTKLIIQLRNWFPDSKERDIRMGILMALLGFPIDTQNDLPNQITSILIEATNETSPYLTRQLSTELQEIIEGSPYGSAWNLPAGVPEGMAVSDL